MKKLISVITDRIIEKLRHGEVNMVRLECFDDPSVYSSVCKMLRTDDRIDNFIPRLTLEKFLRFQEARSQSYEAALDFLKRGDDTSPSGYVDFDNAITKWRNESPELPKGETSLILLMGTEASTDDSGSLRDTTFVISPREIVEELQKDYSVWFDNILKKNGIASDESSKAIDTLFRTIFLKINVDIFSLSTFVDSTQEMTFATSQELVVYICETLDRYWRIPPVIDSKYVPKVKALSKGQQKSAKIISDAVEFINRASDIPSPNDIGKIREKFKKFATDNEIDISAPFVSGRADFDSFSDFEKCVIDFMRGSDVDMNRERLLSSDYAIISQIIGTKLPKKTSAKAVKVQGSPVESLSRIFLMTQSEFFRSYESFPSVYTIRVDAISLPDCVDDEKEESFHTLCDFLGGIMNFFESADTFADDEKPIFAYDDDTDPFDPQYFQDVRDKVKGTGKWGDPCRIKLTVKAKNSENSHSYEYKWSFSPYCSWLNAFRYLRTALLADDENYLPPTLVKLRNMNDFLRCKSEEEFFSRLSQADTDNLCIAHRKQVHSYFSDSNVCGIFDSLCDSFAKFAKRLSANGYYNALPELRETVDTYTMLMDTVRDNFSSFTSVQKEKSLLLVNCFLMAANDDLPENCAMSAAILPAYHPVMLEKIDAKQIFLRDGFASIMRSVAKDHSPLTNAAINAKIDSLAQLSSITEGVDTVMNKTNNYLRNRGMWEYYGVYYNTGSPDDFIPDESPEVTGMVDDDDQTVSFAHTPMSDIVLRSILDYVNTFPARADGLNLTFIDPCDTQHIVSAIHTAAKRLEANGVPSTINLSVISKNSQKNQASSLKRLLYSSFSDIDLVKVNARLLTVPSDLSKQTPDTRAALFGNCDICFNYDLLSPSDICFDLSGDEIITRDQEKFPMTFTPDTIAATHGKSRRISISQFQFRAAKSHTQASYIAGNPNSINGIYRAFETLVLDEAHERMIDLSHEYCKWVVCIDKAIDRKLLEAPKRRIIGFTTGEGAYGELNVTVSARGDILTDIKNMFKRRIGEKFVGWDRERLQKAADFCVDDMSAYMDGSRILKALNPYDYEINNYLAYILTLQILHLTGQDDNYALRTLISLDSYRHWFDGDCVSDDDRSDKKRPDFMLIEIPKGDGNSDTSGKLRLNIKLIECKIGFENDVHIIKAKTQLENGLRLMSRNWEPSQDDIRQRYFRNQLYRAIIFSPLNLSDASAEYPVIRNKIFGILSGNYEIEWSGDVFAFWLDSDSEIQDEYEIMQDLSAELSENGVRLKNLFCHEFGQTFIQKMLVPPDERSSSFTHQIISSTANEPDDDEISDEPADIIPESEKTPEKPKIITTSQKPPERVRVSITPQKQPETEKYETAAIPEEPRGTKEPEAVAEPPEKATAPEGLESARFLIGDDPRTKEKFYWEFGNKGLGNRHLLINGSSGCGKTYCIQTLLLEMVRAGVSGVVFDYTSGFTRDKLDPVFVSELGEKLVQRIVYVDKIPANPFARQMIRVGGRVAPEDDTLVATRVANVFQSVYDFGGQQTSALYKAIRSGLKRHDGKMSFAYLEKELEDVSQKQAETVLSKIQPFLDLAPFADDEEFNWGSIRDSGGMVYIMQLDGFDRPTQLLITEFLLWDIWNFCVRTGNEEHPFVIVMDEAQNLSHKEGSPSEKFLSEGRKFGISGWYATQFMKPQLTDDEIQRLQNSSQKLFFRPPDDGILTVAKSIDINPQGAKDWATKLKLLNKGECVTCGSMVRNGVFTPYTPRKIRVTSLSERIKHDKE